MVLVHEAWVLTNGMDLDIHEAWALTSLYILVQRAHLFRIFFKHEKLSKINENLQFRRGNTSVFLIFVKIVIFERFLNKWAYSTNGMDLPFTSLLLSRWLCVQSWWVLLRRCAQDTVAGDNRGETRRMIKRTRYYTNEKDEPMAVGRRTNV